MVDIRLARRNSGWIYITPESDAGRAWLFDVLDKPNGWDAPGYVRHYETARQIEASATKDGLTCERGGAPWPKEV